MLFVIVSVLVVTLLDFQLRVGPHTHFRGLTKTRRADGPDDGSDGRYQCILQPPVFYTVLGGFTYR